MAINYFTAGFALGILIAVAACASTRLEAVDARAVLDQQYAAQAILTRVDGGPVASLAEAIYCSAGGTLHRAGLPSADGGVPCPKQ